MSIKGKEKIGHVTITLVEQFPVVCFYRMSEQEYEFRVIHEGKPKTEPSFQDVHLALSFEILCICW